MNSDQSDTRFDLPWLILRLEHTLYALETSQVSEMVRMLDLSTVPHAPDYVRGYATRRDRTLTVLDLRKRLGLSSFLEQKTELVSTLEMRLQDHVNWLAELESCVQENRQFKLATDPHKCAFGKWYDHFETDNLALASHLKKFDTPHKKIHALAATVLGLEASGKIEEANEALDRARKTTLRQLEQLFGEGIDLIQDSMQETLVILENAEQLVGLTTDYVDSVEYLKEDSLEEIRLSENGNELNGSMAKNVAKTVRDDRLVLVLDAKELLCSVPEEVLMH